jgi:hypothetical protein
MINKQRRFVFRHHYPACSPIYQIESASRRNYLNNLLKEIETINLEKAKTELS